MGGKLTDFRLAIRIVERPDDGVVETWIKLPRGQNKRKRAQVLDGDVRRIGERMPDRKHGHNRLIDNGHEYHLVLFDNGGGG